MSSQSGKTFEFGPFHLELDDHLLSRNGKIVPLTPKAFDVLVCLLEHRGHLVEKDDLMREVWADSFVEEGNVSRTVWMLRNALGDDRNGHKYIQTIPKHGYRFVADVRIVDGDQSVSTEIVDTNGSVLKAANRASRAEVHPAGNGPSASPDPEERAQTISNMNRFWLEHRTRAMVLAILLLGGGAPAFIFLPRTFLRSRVESAEQINTEAQSAHLLGVYACAQARNSQTPGEAKTDYLKGIEALERTTKLEPTSAEGFADLADCAVWWAAAQSIYYAMAKEAAKSAIKLDDSNVKAHYSLAFALWRGDWDRVGARREFDRAIELDRGHQPDYPGYALFLSSEGRHEEAIRVMERAARVDPNNYINRHNLGYVYLRAKRYDEAIEKFRVALEIYPKQQLLGQVGLGVALACAGRSDEAMDVTRRSIENLPDPFPKTDDKMRSLRLAWVYAKVGRRDDAFGILREMEKLEEPEPGSPNVMQFVAAYAELGEKDKAFAWLRKAFDSRSQTLCWLKTAPEYEKLRDDPRYIEMLDHLGLEP